MSGLKHQSALRLRKPKYTVVTEITIEKDTGAMRWLASSGLIKKHMINPKEVRDDKDGTNKKITGH